MEKVNQSAVREISRRIHNSVATDWDYPVPEHLQKRQTLKELLSLQWRERYYGGTDDEADTSGVEDEADTHTAPSQAARDHAFTYDSPEHVGTIVNNRSERRKRKRNEQIEAEFESNEGLRLYQRRRNEWTGALTRTDYDRLEASRDSMPSTHGEGMVTDPPISQTDNVRRSVQDLSLADGEASISRNTNDTLFEPSQLESLQTGLEPINNPSSLTNVLIPLATPIVPADNPIRSQMTHKSPSDLYDKVVRDTRSPVIPINLAHMMKIVVQGWKDEGNWPPGSAPVPEPFLATRRRAHNGVAPATGGAGTGEHGILANHRHLRQGVNSVKRVLRLSSDKISAPSSPKGGSFPGGEREKKEEKGYGEV